MGKDNKKVWYAWTEITLTPEVTPPVRPGDLGHIVSYPMIKPGARVTPEILGISNNEFNKLIREKAIRSRPYPRVKTNESPKNALLRERREAIESIERGEDFIDALEDDSDFDDITGVNTNDDDTDVSQGFANDAERLARLGLGSGAKVVQ